MSQSQRADADRKDQEGSSLNQNLAGSMRAIIKHPFGGKLVMTGFPGLETGFDGEAVFTPDQCRETLEGIHAQGAHNLVVLVERDELDPVGFELLESTAADIGMTITYLPIVDYSVPSEATVKAWMATRPARLATLHAGGTLAFSCQYGAGRSGLMASWSLMEGGLNATDAIAFVRSHFSEAVESTDQETWLQDTPVGGPA